MEKGNNKKIRQFDFILNVPIKYALDGNETQAQLLALKAPSNKSRKYAAKLKQGFYKSIVALKDTFTESDTSSNKKEENDKFDGEQVVQMLMMAGVVDFEDYLDNFKKLITNHGICRIDDKMPLNDHLFDEISYDDSERLLGDYLSTFLVSSL